MKTETLEAIIALSAIASTDQSRYNINGVHVESFDDGKKVRIQATNGHMAAIQELEDSLPSGKYIMRGDAIAVAKLVLKECKSVGGMECDIDSNKGLIYGNTTKGRMEKAENFPDIEQIMPKHRHRAAVTLDAEYILALAKIAQRASGFGGKRPFARIVFDPTQSSSAVSIERDGVEGLRMVVMPARDGGVAQIAAECAEIFNHIPDDAIISLPQTAT